MCFGQGSPHLTQLMEGPLTDGLWMDMSQNTVSVESSDKKKTEKAACACVLLRYCILLHICALQVCNLFCSFAFEIRGLFISEFGGGSGLTHTIPPAQHPHRRPGASRSSRLRMVLAAAAASFSCCRRSTAARSNRRWASSRF